ncbi:MAG: ATP-binding protein [Alcanivoracaceae bacterium]|nr:ATP-binding protein [Alcanivoracaceae bacterium]
MSIIAGQAVRGDNFWDRPYLMADIFDVVESGGHILLVAPRRVGKTSLMYRIKDTVNNDYIVVYVNTQAAHSANAFWEKLFEQLMDEEFINTLKSKAKKLYKILKSIRVSEVSIKGIKFGKSKTINYAKAFETLLKSLDNDKKLIIMLDEFSQTIENIIKYQSIEEAEQLLENHRDLRQNHRLLQKTVFVYAGSIGLESVVANIQSSKHINDLVNVDVPPLEYDDAKSFALHLCSSNKMTIEEADIEYMLDKILWLIPFNIQLVAQELKRLYRREPIINSTVVDAAIENVLKHKKDFIHWQERLEIFDKIEYNFSIDVLNTLSTNGKIPSTEIFNLASKHKLEESKAKTVIHALRYDGYINNKEDARTYHFNSPILRTWWYRNVAN